MTKKNAKASQHRAQMTVERVGEEPDGTRWFDTTITADIVDRQGEVLDPAGFTLKEYRDILLAPIIDTHSNVTVGRFIPESLRYGKVPHPDTGEMVNAILGRGVVFNAADHGDGYEQYPIWDEVWEHVKRKFESGQPSGVSIGGDPDPKLGKQIRCRNGSCHIFVPKVYWYETSIVRDGKGPANPIAVNSGINAMAKSNSRILKFDLHLLGQHTVDRIRKGNYNFTAGGVGGSSANNGIPIGGEEWRPEANVVPARRVERFVATHSKSNDAMKIVKARNVPGDGWPMQNVNVGHHNNEGFLSGGNNDSGDANAGGHNNVETQRQTDAFPQSITKSGQVSGLTIAHRIEYEPGDVRSGVDKNGKKWSRRIKLHYGDFDGSKGADGEKVDFYARDDEWAWQHPVFIVNQIDQDTGRFDEHKVMLGFGSAESAKNAYLENYPKGWKCGPIKGMEYDEFKRWLMKPGSRSRMSKYVGKTKGGYKAFSEDGKPLSKKPKSAKEAYKQLYAVEQSKGKRMKKELHSNDSEGFSLRKDGNAGSFSGGGDSGLMVTGDEGTFFRRVGGQPYRRRKTKGEVRKAILSSLNKIGEAGKKQPYGMSEEDGIKTHGFPPVPFNDPKKYKDGVEEWVQRVGGPTYAQMAIAAAMEIEQQEMMEKGRSAIDHPPSPFTMYLFRLLSMIPQPEMAMVPPTQSQMQAAQGDESDDSGEEESSQPDSESGGSSEDSDSIEKSLGSLDMIQGRIVKAKGAIPGGRGGNPGKAAGGKDDAWIPERLRPKTPQQEQQEKPKQAPMVGRPPGMARKLEQPNQPKASASHWGVYAEPMGEGSKPSKSPTDILVGGMEETAQKLRAKHGISTKDPSQFAASGHQPSMEHALRGIQDAQIDHEDAQIMEEAELRLKEAETAQEAAQAQQQIETIRQGMEAQRTWTESPISEKYEAMGLHQPRSTTFAQMGESLNQWKQMPGNKTRSMEQFTADVQLTGGDPQRLANLSKLRQETESLFSPISAFGQRGFKGAMEAAARSMGMAAVGQVSPKLAKDIGARIVLDYLASKNLKLDDVVGPKQSWLATGIEDPEEAEFASILEQQKRAGRVGRESSRRMGIPRPSLQGRHRMPKPLHVREAQYGEDVAYETELRDLENSYPDVRNHMDKLRAAVPEYDQMGSKEKFETLQDFIGAMQFPLRVDRTRNEPPI